MCADAQLQLLGAYTLIPPEDTWNTISEDEKSVFRVLKFLMTPGSVSLSGEFDIQPTSQEALSAGQTVAELLEHVERVMKGRNQTVTTNHIENINGV